MEECTGNIKTKYTYEKYVHVENYKSNILWVSFFVKHGKQVLFNLLINQSNL